MMSIARLDDTAAAEAVGPSTAMGERRAVSVNGVRLNVYVAGAGPDVLLVHGFPDDALVWRLQVPALVRAGYRVIAPDTRGCGDSEAPLHADAYTASVLVSDMAALLDALNVRTARLIAHDWGAVVGWQLCMRHPERVERYAALSVGHPRAYARAPIEQRLRSYYVLGFQLRGIAERLLTFDDWRLFRKLTDFPEETDRWVARLSRPGRLGAALNYYRANLDLFLSRDWPDVRMPVLGLWSNGDHFLCEQQMTDSARFVSALWSYRRLSGASHWLQLDAAGEVNDLLISFLDQGERV
jgi:pimeloyl-ACP methyl ester carboxylesterase